MYERDRQYFQSIFEKGHTVNVFFKTSKLHLQLGEFVSFDNRTDEYHIGMLSNISYNSNMIPIIEINWWIEVDSSEEGKYCGLDIQYKYPRQITQTSYCSIVDSTKNVKLVFVLLSSMISKQKYSYCLGMKDMYLGTSWVTFRNNEKQYHYFHDNKQLQDSYGRFITKIFEGMPITTSQVIYGLRLKLVSNLRKVLSRKLKSQRLQGSVIIDLTNSEFDMMVLGIDTSLRMMKKSSDTIKILRHDFQWKLLGILRRG